MLHGWGDSRLGALSRLPALLPVSSRVLAIDLPGHGESPGVSSLGHREAAAIQALIESVSRDERATTEESCCFVLVGWSMGAGIAIEVASCMAGEARIAGVIAEAPYRHAITPARNMLRLRALPSGWNLRVALAIVRWISGWRGGGGSRPFDRAALAASSGVPMLVIHGDADEISPIEDGRAIAAAAPRARLVALPSATHFGLWTDPETGERLTREVRGFLALLA